MKFFNKIREKYRKYKLAYDIIYRPKFQKGIAVKGSHIPFFQKIKYNYYGFTDKEIIEFDLLHNDFHNYISFWERFKLEFVNGRFADILGEKVIFPRIFGNYINIPHVYAYIKNCKILNCEDTGWSINPASLLKEKGALIIKPTRSVGGV